MSPDQHPRRGTGAHRLWLRIGIGVLALVVLLVAYVQWRQYKLLDAASDFENDALSWSFSQLETEQLRLRSELQRYLADAQHAGAADVQMRYDIFVSRVGLVDHERAAGVMKDEPAYLPALALVHAFVKQADQSLGPHPVEALNADNATALMASLTAMSTPLHELSLGASHLLYQRAAERNAAVRQQSELGVGLTAFQVVLLLSLAFIVLRQFRALSERRRRLEALADSLGTARVDAEAANRAKSAFLANMSHEIRTPFHGMLGMMSLLQDSGLSAKQSMYLDTARDSAQHLLAILNDILDISQLETGKLQVAPQTLELIQLLNQVDALMRPQALAKGLSLRVEVAPDVPRWVRGDPTRVRQILFNLLSNALKFTLTGGIVLSVTRSAEGRLDFNVTDSGIGMDDATQARLFQRFMQGDERPSRRASGTGLGLEISRDLARLMGGDITARSQPGQGSTFIASLPLPAVAAPTQSSDNADAAGAARPSRPLRVLVAEDHAVNRAYLEAVLEKLGHHGVFVSDGHAAVLAMQTESVQEPFDIVLMDLHMPDMDGFTAARTIRAMPPPRGRVPIVALTADAFPASRELASQAGMQGFLTKPAHLPQLREALQRYGANGATGPSPEATVAETVPTTPNAPDSLLDMATVNDVVHALTPTRYSELLQRFFEERHATVDALRRAAAESSPVTLRERAHSLKGASASLGLSAVSALAHQLNPHNDAANPLPDDLDQLLDRLDEVFELSRAQCVSAGLLGDVTPPAAPARA